MAPNMDKDTSYAWVVVAAAFLVNVITDGLAYSAGILLVELLEVFGEGRGYTGVVGALLVGIMHLIGPLVASFTQRHGARLMVVSGSLIAAVGIAISYFATDVTFFCLSFGVLGGVGFGMIYVPPSLCVLQSFDKYLALATGLSACGSGFGSVVFTQVLPIFFEMYGLRGSMLILSGIVLNGTVLGLLLWPISNANDTCDESADYNSYQPKKRLSIWTIPYNDFQIGNNKTRNFSKRKVYIARQRAFSVDVTVSQEIIKPRQRSFSECHKDRFVTDENESVTINECKPGNDALNKTDTEFSEAVEIESPGNFNNKTETQVNTKEKHWKIYNIMCSKTLIKMPSFWMFMISIFVYVFASTFVFTLLPDQVELSGMSKTKASWLVAVIGICNTTGRVVFGLIGNRKYLKTIHMTVFLMLMTGAITLASSWMTSFPAKVIYTIVFGSCLGGVQVFCFTLQIDLFGDENVPFCFGWLMFAIGTASLASTPIGGLLYDMTGEYYASFLTSGGLLVLSSVIMAGTLCVKTSSSYNIKKKYIERKVSKSDQVV